MSKQVEAEYWICKISVTSNKKPKETTGHEALWSMDKEDTLYKAIIKCMLKNGERLKEVQLWTKLKKLYQKTVINLSEALKTVKETGSVLKYTKMVLDTKVSM